MVGLVLFLASGTGARADSSNWMVMVAISENQLYLYREGKLVRSYPVSVGEMVTPTPLGKWVILEKITNPGPPFGTRWMRLHRWEPAFSEYQRSDYGIHGTDEVDKLGAPASAGCIRLDNPDVEELFAQLPVGTRVVTLP